jgi:hypothetical protein
MKFNRVVIKHKSEGTCNDVFVICLNLRRNKEHDGKVWKKLFPSGKNV